MQDLSILMRLFYPFILLQLSWSIKSTSLLWPVSEAEDLIFLAFREEILLVSLPEDT